MESYDFGRYWWEWSAALVVIGLGYIGVFVYGIVTGQGPHWSFGALLLVVWAVGVTYTARCLVRTATFDGRVLRVRTLLGERAIEVGQIESVGWYSRIWGWGALSIVRYRGGQVGIPAASGAGLLRRLKRAAKQPRSSPTTTPEP